MHLPFSGHTCLLNTGCVASLIEVATKTVFTVCVKHSLQNFALK